MFLFTFIFSLPLIFTLVAASISHFLTAAIKFSRFSSKKRSPLFFISRSSSFSVTPVKVDIKIKSKERISFIIVFISKSPGGMRFTVETRGCLTSAYTKGVDVVPTYQN